MPATIVFSYRMFIRDSINHHFVVSRFKVFVNLLRAYNSRASIAQ